jgi:hypothetical protein
MLIVSLPTSKRLVGMELVAEVRDERGRLQEVSTRVATPEDIRLARAAGLRHLDVVASLPLPPHRKVREVRPPLVEAVPWS